MRILRNHRISLSYRISLSLGLAFGALALPACDSNGSGVTDDGGATGETPDAGPGGPSADGGPGCPSTSVRLDPVTPTVLLLLDQSGSMTTGFGGTDRWNAMKSSLVDPTNGVVTQLQDSVIFGATLYTSDNGGATCPVLTSVAPAMSNLSAINGLLQANEPEDDTPTGASIVGATGILSSLAVDPDAPPSPKIIVLATDGEPDTCAVPDPQTQAGKDEAIAAAQAAYAAGIRLFILSVGNEVGAAHQQDMANAGAGKPLDHSAGDAPFYGAENPGDLRAAFDEIINGVRTCTFALDGNVADGHASEGTVILNGQALGYDDPNGWTLTDPSTLELQGTACEAFLADPSVSLSADFPCGVVVE
jgi:hypothetical protein